MKQELEQQQEKQQKYDQQLEKQQEQEQYHQPSISSRLLTAPYHGRPSLLHHPDQTDPRQTPPDITSCEPSSKHHSKHRPGLLQLTVLDLGNVCYAGSRMDQMGSNPSSAGHNCTKLGPGTKDLTKFEQLLNHRNKHHPGQKQQQQLQKNFRKHINFVTKILENCFT